MRLRNGQHGYGAVTKLLHWATLGVLVAQVVVGYTMDAEQGFEKADCDQAAERRSGGDTAEAREERAERAEERCEAEQERLEEEREGSYAAFDGPLDALDLHVGLGLALIALALARIVWRRTTPLPPWSPRLSDVDRFLLTWVERALLWLLVVVPATGIVLVRGGEDLLWLHVAGHVALYAAAALHVGIVLRRRVLGRMLPGGR